MRRVVGQEGAQICIVHQLGARVNWSWLQNCFNKKFMKEQLYAFG
jgi:hypothetical protein